MRFGLRGALSNIPHSLRLSSPAYCDAHTVMECLDAGMRFHDKGASLIQVPCFDEPVDLLPRALLVILLLAFIERNHLLDRVNHGFDVHRALRQPD